MFGANRPFPSGLAKVSTPLRKGNTGQLWSVRSWNRSIGKSRGRFTVANELWQSPEEKPVRNQPFWALHKPRCPRALRYQPVRHWLPGTPWDFVDSNQTGLGSQQDPQPNYY